MRAIALAFALVTVAAACGGSSTPAVDAAPVVDAFASTCGKPGDLGNELGVGKFCTAISDCSSTASAPLCSTIGDSTTFFCTKICTMAGSGTECGTGATCTCNSSNQCGCTPNTCLTN